MTHFEFGKYIALNPKGNKFEFTIKEENVFKFNNKPFDVKIEINNDGFTYIESNGIKYPIEILSKNQNKYEVLINNVSYIFTIETPFSFKRKNLLNKNQQGSRTELIQSPMPGKILEVMVHEGDDIGEGDALLILEAMKMQNEITSHVSGKIKKIFFKAGDNVMKDDIMIEIDK